MPGRYIALGNRHETHRAFLGGEQVIAVRIEAAVRSQIPDRKELALGIEEKSDLYCVEHFHGQFTERIQTSPERPRGTCGVLESVDQNLQANFERVARGA